MKVRILAFLLHHANRNPIYRDDFYAIKKKILDYYGTPEGADMQILPGKKCYTCDGTGIYTGYYWQSGEAWHDTCNRCWRGWYISPKYVVLHRIRLGRYVFHQPGERYDTPADIPVQYRVPKEQQIQGYKEFTPSIWTHEAHLWLFWFFDRPRFWYMWRWRASWPHQAGLLVRLRELKCYWQRELERRREHLDFGQLPQPDTRYEVHSWHAAGDDDIPF
ncbi:hypothetical protein [Spirosoma sp.]|uniref:hypothetical protein n=1 Tax=Spirosoma sp. TaxID=1899569 RepID=UPI0026149BDE|nr:hypothetical protein [Spirosoma sp.]MCX6217586.1 hypothetical protein [Spirosoma sp.]